MGVPEYTNNVSERTPSTPSDELDQPYGAEKLQMEGGFNPFPEAVVADPVIIGRRRSQIGTFENESLESFYKPIDAFEGSHRYDPQFQWEKKEEQRLVRKIDWKICTWACLMFFALQLDRGNIVQALSDGMLDDLGLSSNDYNYGQTIFYLCFLCAELPSQLISKKLGPDNWIPVQMVSWSLVASMQAFLSGRTSFWICRALLGVIEGGFIPDVILYLSYFYKSNELPRRLSFFWVAYQSTKPVLILLLITFSIVSAFLAYGILRMRGVDGRPGWAWLFALEGTVTGIIGLISYFYLPPSPYQTASKFRGKDGWFSEHEEKILANRILRDDPSKGDMHNRQGLSLSAFRMCITDYHMWPIYLIGLSWLIPTVPMQGYITLNMTEVGFGTFETNLLTVPAFTLFIIGLLFWTWLSEKLNERFLLATLSQIWVLPALIALVCLPTTRSPWSNYALSVITYGMPYFHAVFVAITSRNAGSVRTRTVASALYNMCVQSGNIIGINIYRTDDAPYYYRGNKVLIAIACYNIVLLVATKFFYVSVNKKRDQKWNAMSKEEKEHYLATTTDRGNKRLDFRFAH